MKQVISWLFKRKNDKNVKKLDSIVLAINSFEEDFKKLSDEELKAKTPYFKDLLKQGKSLDDILPEAFAVVKEASSRTLGIMHYNVQLIGGIVLHKGMISEMATGEGKTLVSTLPAYLNALTERPVHIVTVNDYLATRDSAWMGKIYNFLGLSVGCIVGGEKYEEKEKNYKCDIVYASNYEIGFDYLRSNMQVEKDKVLIQDNYFAIVDEVDSVLIDEARTPLVISGAVEDRAQIYRTINGFVKLFTKDDYELDEKNKNINITEQGMDKLEKILQNRGIKNAKQSLYEDNNAEIYHLVTQVLKAHYLFIKEKDYIVRDGSIVIIDELSGRALEGRRFADGLHQALEAKENIEIRRESQTIASISFQNYFKLYEKLAGMTGTAHTELDEFLEIYGLDVVQIPTNKNVIRQDLDDQVYLTVEEKERAILKAVQEAYAKKQPILIGTVSIEKSDKMSALLKKNNIRHNVLNAKHHDKEASIIACAGEGGAVTIATNMAGRGTDIQLGGNLDLALEKINRKTYKSEISKQEAIERVKSEHAENKQQVIDASGLLVIGTERYESRRIDNQLRGRAGRQGDPGKSVFFTSMEDDLLRLFGSDNISGMLRKIGVKKDEVISHPWISKAIEKTQVKAEKHNFEIRKYFLRFDSIINEQRAIIYKQRQDIIFNKADVKEDLNANIEFYVCDLVDKFMPEKDFRENWQLKQFELEIGKTLDVKYENLEQKLINEGMNREDFIDELLELTYSNIDTKAKGIGEEDFYNFMRIILLQIIDESWKMHLINLDYIRSGINLRAIGQKDPFYEFKKESFISFNNMLEQVRVRSAIATAVVKVEKEAKK